MHSMRRWSTSLPAFLISNYLVATWLPEHNSLGGRMPALQCYVLPTPTVDQPNIFLNNAPFFATPIKLQTALTASLKVAH